MARAISAARRSESDSKMMAVALAHGIFHGGDSHHSHEGGGADAGATSVLPECVQTVVRHPVISILLGIAAEISIHLVAHVIADKYLAHHHGGCKCKNCEEHHHDGEKKKEAAATIAASPVRGGCSC